MRAPLPGVIAALALAAGVAPPAAAQAVASRDAGTAQAGEVRTTSLDGAWEFRQAASSDQRARDPAARAWRAATVPGTVHTDLLANGAIADPYVGIPEPALQWIGLADWEYRRTFEVDAATAASPRSRLVFDGLDTLATVRLNGATVLQADNAFRTWRVPVEGRLKPGRNTLEITFRSPIRALLPQVQAMPHRIAGNYPSPHGDEPADAMTANFVRKPGYHYGWDWGPRYVTAGVWRPVTLQAWSAARIDDLHVRQDRVEAARADLTAVVAFDTAAAGDYTLVLDRVDPDGRRARVHERRVALAAGDGALALPVRIDAPRRWYPVGHGAQPLYRFEAALLRDGRRVDARSVRTGLRSIELRRDASGGGRGFAFVVNGIPVFAKGANAIPLDAFEPRVDAARIRRVLQSAVDANMNMVRSWGGGYYERDEFFAIADELGLMVWQDFMFGGGMQPAYDPAFRANVVAEAREQVRRLRNHPSIVLWCGNNEEEIAWKYWGHGRDLAKASPAFARKVWDGYVQLFGHDLRGVVAEEGGGIGYWPSSPSNDLAEDANRPDAGDMHYWEVWGNPAHPVAKYLEVTPRFMSEYGLQAWPSPRTLRAHAGGLPLAVDSPFVGSRQKFMAGKGNARQLHYIRMEFGDVALDGAERFDDFVYLGQAMQAEGIALAARHHRASRPWTMGSLYWQLNDVWPGASWSGIDVAGRPKALQFHVRRAFAPVALAALRRDGTTTVSLLSDRHRALRGTLRLRVFDLDGRLLRDERSAVDLPPNTATVAGRHDDAALLRGADPARTVAVFDLAVDGEPPARDIVHFAAAKDLRWQAPGITVAWQDGDTGEPRVALTATRYARAAWLDFGELDAAPADNAFALLPGETATIPVDSRLPVDTLRRALRIRTLADVIAPAPPPQDRTPTR